MPYKTIEARQPAGNSPVHDNELLDVIFRNRGITGADELDNGLQGLLSPSTMKGMTDAAEIITKHILSGSRIIIVGDYDCDGATATSIAVEGLQLLGASNVDFVIPDRMKHGYGLSPAVVDLAAEEKPDLIITVDNGIASIEGAERVKSLDHACDLVITDHHLAPERGLPVADAIVNPNQPGCPFESKNIAGCGVMFYTILAVRAKLREMGHYADKEEPQVGQLLDLVALGTVADVVPMDKNNRILVKAGLDRVNAGMVRPGLKALLEIGKRRIGNIVTTDFGFAAGPRLNAAGRLEDMSAGIRCLLDMNTESATQRAEALDGINQRRKDIEADMTSTAVEACDNFTTERFGVCLHEPDWHEGVVGITASRIKERLNRPVICFSDTHGAKQMRESIEAARSAGDLNKAKELEEALLDCEIKGSARSVDGFHLKHALDGINKAHPEMLAKFGGHAMAAGLGLKIRHFEAFQDAFDAAVRHDLTATDLEGRLTVDVKDLDSRHLTVETAELLRTAQPWGQKFETPSFSARFFVENVKVLQDKHLKLTLKPVDGGARIDGICFGCVENGIVPVRDEIEAVFKLDINEWRGRRTLQLMVDHVYDERLELEMKQEQKEAPGSVALPGLTQRKKSTPSTTDFSM